MTKIAAWHDVNADCYHNNSECAFAEEVPLEQRVPGDGGKPLCRICASLERAAERLPS